MKTASDPRHLERIKVMQELFAWDFINSNTPENKKAREIILQKTGIDALITQAAPNWPIEKINKIDLALLRLAIFELTIEKSAPPKVVIDEAVELAKEFGSDSSASFINGSLGKIIELTGINV